MYCRGACSNNLARLPNHGREHKVVVTSSSALPSPLTVRTQGLTALSGCCIVRRHHAEPKKFGGSWPCGVQDDVDAELDLDGGAGGEDAVRGVVEALHARPQCRISVQQLQHGALEDT